MSKLDIAEKRLPQDGRISLRIAGRAVDVRVSTIPSGHGERVVLRLLDKQAGRFELSQLGMDESTRESIDKLIHRPHGIILVTAPTAVFVCNVDMGVEPFLLSSSLIGVLAQRLVRVLCTDCRQTYAATKHEINVLNVPGSGNVMLYRADGCEMCNQTGYRGRTGIYELVCVDDELRTMIHDGAGEHQLEAHARTSSPSIRADARQKVLDGITSVGEVLRVTQED